MKLKHDIDFYSVYRRQRNDTQRAAHSRHLLFPLILAAVAVAFVAASLSMQHRTSLLAAEEKEMTSYLSSSEAAQQSASVTSLQQQYQLVQEYNDLVQTAHDSIGVRPIFTRGAYTAPMRAIEKNGGILTGLTMDGDTLYSFVRFDKQLQAASAEDALKATGAFDTLWYEGWTYQENTTTTQTVDYSTATPTVITNSNTTKDYMAVFTCMLKEVGE